MRFFPAVKYQNVSKAPGRIQPDTPYPTFTGPMDPAESLPPELIVTPLFRYDRNMTRRARMLQAGFVTAG